jgi:cytochrome c peroxidase
VRFGVRVPSGPFPGAALKGPAPATVTAGRNLFQTAGCTTCHFGGLWSGLAKDFNAPPAGTEIATERTGTFQGNPIGAQFLPRFLKDIGSFNLGVAGAGNDIGGNIGAVEKTTQPLVAGVAGVAQDALGFDWNSDGKGTGFNVGSLLGIHASPPYYHNGACESIACVVGNFKHRTGNGRLQDRLGDAPQQAQVVAFVESISAATDPFNAP